MKTEEFNRYDVAGFTLAGYGQTDGSVVTEGGTHLECWPETVTLMGLDYGLNKVVNCARVPGKGTFQYAEYM